MIRVSTRVNPCCSPWPAFRKRWLATIAVSYPASRRISASVVYEGSRRDESFSQRCVDGRSEVISVVRLGSVQDEEDCARSNTTPFAANASTFGDVGRFQP